MDILFLQIEILESYITIYSFDMIRREEGGQPDVFGEDQSRHHQELSKLFNINTEFLESVKVYAGSFEQIDTILRKHVLREREFEIELPTGAAIDPFTFFVGK
jgi:hypothetical protein